MTKHLGYMTVLALIISLPAIPAGNVVRAATPTIAKEKAQEKSDEKTEEKDEEKSEEQEELAKRAKIYIEQARETALKTSPGKITDEELEEEEGGSGLRYSFDIQQGDITREVGVDAVTGKLLEDSKEGKNPD